MLKVKPFQLKRVLNPPSKSGRELLTRFYPHDFHILYLLAHHRLDRQILSLREWFFGKNTALDIDSPGLVIRSSNFCLGTEHPVGFKPID